MKYEKYMAYDSNGVLRYVGIGKPGRHRHVNSGKSHSDILNACVAVAGPFRIVVEYEVGSDAESKAKEWEVKTISKIGRLHLNSGPLLNRSPGGEESNTSFDTSWYSSPDGKQSKRFKDETLVPPDWVRGRVSLKGKTGWNGVKGRKPPIRKNWKAWHNPETGEIRQISKDEPVPVGFVEGTGLKQHAGTIWCINDTGQVKRFVKDSIPAGFRPGRK